MALWEVSFRCQYNYPLIEISRCHPDLAIQVWCLGSREWVLLPSQDERVLSDIETDLVAANCQIEERAESPEGRVLQIVDGIPRSWGIQDILTANQCWVTHPWTYSGGWGHFRILTFSPGGSSGLFRDLRERGPVVLVRKVELPLNALPSTVWIQGLMAGLTTRQRESLEAACLAGYFETPKRATTTTLARQTGLARSTFGEHLRAAENKIFGALAEYLALRAPPPTASSDPSLGKPSAMLDPGSRTSARTPSTTPRSGGGAGAPESIPLLG